MIDDTQDNPFDARRRALMNLVDYQQPAPSAPSKAPEGIGGVLGSIIGGIVGAAGGPAGVATGIGIGGALGSGAGKLVEGDASGAVKDIGTGTSRYESFSDYLKKQRAMEG